MNNPIHTPIGNPIGNPMGNSICNPMIDRDALVSDSSTHVCGPYNKTVGFHNKTQRHYRNKLS